MARPIDFNLYLITDRKVVPEGKTLLETLEAALLGGVHAIQLREKDMDAADLLPLARQLRELTNDYQAKLLINDRIDMALAVEADGVHLGGHSLPIAVARKLLGAEKLIGVSTHNQQQLGAAVAGGADFITFGPIWYTLSKTLPGEPVGLDALQDACAQSTVPVFALGGVTPKGIPELLAHDCRHVACIGGILQAEDPTAAVRTFLSQLDA